MWQTSEGNRTLDGAEAELIAQAVTRMAEAIAEDDFAAHMQRSIALFDDLGDTCRLDLLEVVATHLLHPTTRTLELTAVNEATVGAIFRQVQMSVEHEIDCELQSPTALEGKTKWRQRVFTAFTECFPDEAADIDEPDDEFYDEFTPRSATCTDRDQWESVIDSLADRILWDRDYEMAELMMDQPAMIANKMKAMLGIDPNYFVGGGPTGDSLPTASEVTERFARICQPR